MTEREAFEARYAGVHFSDTFMNAAWDGWESRAALAALRAPQAAPVADEKNADALDAARYRWLRNPTVDVGLVLDKVVGSTPYDAGTDTGGYLHYEYRSGEELDKSIDARLTVPPSAPTPQAAPVAASEPKLLTDAEIQRIAETLGAEILGVRNYDSWGSHHYRRDDAGNFNIPGVPPNALPFARTIEAAVIARQAPALQPEPQTTGWLPSELMQDDHSGLSKALSNTPHARLNAREAAAAISQPEPLLSDAPTIRQLSYLAMLGAMGLAGICENFDVPEDVYAQWQQFAQVIESHLPDSEESSDTLLGITGALQWIAAAVIAKQAPVQQAAPVAAAQQQPKGEGS